MARTYLLNCKIADLENSIAMLERAKKKMFNKLSRTRTIAINVQIEAERKELFRLCKEANETKNNNT